MVEKGTTTIIITKGIIHGKVITKVIIEIITTKDKGPKKEKRIVDMEWNVLE